jgi:26S proteasome regulatory subunit N10
LDDYRIDNSEYMRNGDYPPNRFDAQTDAVTVVFSHKVDSNPENTAGVMTMAGKRSASPPTLQFSHPADPNLPFIYSYSPEVLVTPTQDVGKILSALHTTKISGSVDVVTAIQVAQLALKHRQNKNLRQRIIAFVGSPLPDSLDEKTLVKVGKKLKKNNVALDVVCYGEWEGNEARLKALVEAVQNSENR